MDSAKNILYSLVVDTQKVRNGISQYSTTRGVRQVRQHSLIRLEFEFETIINVSRAILEALSNPRLCRHYLLDDRFVDWLSSTEPDTCLDTLRRMDVLLRSQREVLAVPVFRSPGFAGSSIFSACEEEDVNGAIALYRDHKAHFHFLLTMDIL